MLTSLNEASFASTGPSARYRLMWMAPRHLSGQLTLAAPTGDACRPSECALADASCATIAVVGIDRSDNTR